MAKKFSQPALLFLALIMLVNALGYGVIIPLMYPYAQRFGLDPFGLSLLFTSFSIFQFFATPVMGRLSDKYGRKPLLLLSLLGTGLSFVFFAAANAIWMLFVARILDGITGGNVSVAQAVIADSTTGKDRAKGFGILGAAFGFGFLVGPALGGVLSILGLTVPFWFAAALCFLAVVLGFFFLPETNPKSHRSVKHEPMINLPAIFHALFSPIVGVILAMTLIISTAQSAFIIGFQSFSVDNLKMSSTSVGLVFTAIGLITIIMQAGGISWLVKTFKSKRLILKVSLLLSAITLTLMFFQRDITNFFVANVLYGFAFAPSMVMLTSLISEGTKGEDQGAMLGINQSYLSLGQILGPLVAGVIASRTVPGVFLLGSALMVSGLLMSWHLPKPSTHPVDV